MSTARPLQRQHGGFTLIELMVGMALGLLTTVIIAQVIINADANRQTTTSGSDAQVNGALAMYALTRDLQGAGFGLLSHDSAPGCPIRAKRGSNAELSSLYLVPALRTGDASGNFQRLRLLAAGGGQVNPPMVIKTDHTQLGASFEIRPTMNVPLDMDASKSRDADVLIAIPQTWSQATAGTFGASDKWCTVFEAAADSTHPLDANNLPHVARSTGWNPTADATNTLMPAGGYVDGDYIVNLGTLVVREYWLQNENLMTRSLQADGSWGNDEIVASDIVAMQVMYGKDTLTSSASTPAVVDTYDTTTPTTVLDWRRVLSVRLALVARSSTREKDIVTAQDVYWDVGTSATVKAGSTSASSCPTNNTRSCIKLSLPRANATDTEWQHYRYKVYDTVVPLRNMLWRAS